MERERVDKIRTEIEENPWLKETYEQEKIDLPPSKLRKFGRAALDALNIRLGFSEKRRNREAMSIAIGEIDAEQESRRLEELKQEEDKKAELAKQEADRIKAEEEALQEDMEKSVSATEQFRKDFFRYQRLQETVERNLNSRLLSVETLEEEVLSENPEVAKRSISYEDTEIPIYDLKGLPFSMLSTTIDYRAQIAKNSTVGHDYIGLETSRAIMDNPAIWDQHLDEAMKTEGFGTRGAKARGNVISMSLFSSEQNLNSHVYGELIYGFQHIDANSVLKITKNDGATTNMINEDDYALSHNGNYALFLSLDNLEKPHHNGYNEILVKRYSETGTPKRPDYIITVNGKIPEVSLKHAKFYNIPIVNIVEQPYFEKMGQRCEEIIDSISESDSYDELTKKIADLRSTSQGQKLWPGGKFDECTIEGKFTDPVVGWRDIAKESPLYEKVANIKGLELEKRLKYIKDFMQNTITSVDKMTDTDEQYPEEKDKMALLRPTNEFMLSFYNDEEGCSYVQNRIVGNYQIYGGFPQGTGQNLITITFKDKNGASRTTIFKKDGYDNNLYDEFAPIASNYIKACNKLANLPSRKS